MLEYMFVGFGVTLVLAWLTGHLRALPSGPGTGDLKGEGLAGMS